MNHADYGAGILTALFFLERVVIQRWAARRSKLVGLRWVVDNYDGEGASRHLEM